MENIALLSSYLEFAWNWISCGCPTQAPSTSYMQLVNLVVGWTHVNKITYIDLWLGFGSCSFYKWKVVRWWFNVHFPTKFVRNNTHTQKLLTNMLYYSSNSVACCSTEVFVIRVKKNIKQRLSLCALCVSALFFRVFSSHSLVKLHISYCCETLRWQIPNLAIRRRKRRSRMRMEATLGKQLYLV